MSWCDSRLAPSVADVASAASQDAVAILANSDPRSESYGPRLARCDPAEARSQAINPSMTRRFYIRHAPSVLEPTAHDVCSA